MPQKTYTETSSFANMVTDKKLLELYRYWQRLRGEQPFLLRQNLDPIDIPKLLPNLILSDVTNEGKDIHYRLVGTNITTAHGLDYTGMSADELVSGDTLEFTKEIYRTVVKKMLPVFSESFFKWPDRQYNWTKRLHLPMSKSGDCVDMVLCCQTFAVHKKSAIEQVMPATFENIQADQKTFIK